MARKSNRTVEVLELVDGHYEAQATGELVTAAEAEKWIRGRAKELDGKTICIASMTPLRKVKVKTRETVEYE